MSAINGKEAKAVRRRVLRSTQAALVNEQVTRERVTYLELGTDALIREVASQGERVDALWNPNLRPLSNAEVRMLSLLYGNTLWRRLCWLATGR